MAKIKYVGKFQNITLIQNGRGTKLVKRNTPIDLPESEATELLKGTPENWQDVKTEDKPEEPKEPKNKKEVKK